MSARQYDLTLVAGVPQRIPVIGEKLKVMAAPSGALSIQLDTGELFVLTAGQGVTFEPGKGFTNLFVSSTVSQAVSIFAGDRRIEDTSITGTVSVIDQSRALTIAGRQFYGNDAQPATAGTFSAVSLMANAVNLAIRRMRVSSLVAGTTTWGFATATGTAATAANPVPNKLASGATSTGRTGGGQTAAAVPTGAEVPGYVQVERFQLAAATPIELNFDKSPLIITGTRGIVVLGQAANRDLVVCFDFEEYT